MNSDCLNKSIFSFAGIIIFLIPAQGATEIYALLWMRFIRHNSLCESKPISLCIRPACVDNSDVELSGGFSEKQKELLHITI